MCQNSEFLSLLQEMGNIVDAQGKHITRLDELTKTQAQLIEGMAEELDEVHKRQDAHWLAVWGGNQLTQRTLADFEFFLPAEAVQAGCIAPSRSSCSTTAASCCYSNAAAANACGRSSGPTAAAVIRAGVRPWRRRRSGACTRSSASRPS